MSPPADLSGNPLWNVGELPAFDRIRAEHVIPAVRAHLEHCRRGLEQLEQSVRPTYAGTLVATHQLLDPLGRAWGVIHHLLSVQNSGELRAAHAEVQAEVVELSTRVGQSRPLFDALQELRSGPGFADLDPAQKRIVERQILDMRLTGIDLPEEQRQRFGAIQQELAELSTGYSNAVLDATRSFELLLTEAAEVEGLPDSLRVSAAQSAAGAGHEGAAPGSGPWRITLDAAMVMPFLQHARRRDLREQVYRAWITRASAAPNDNGPRVERILELRAEEAQLLGFETFAELSLATKMAPDVAAVDRLHEELLRAAQPGARRDLEELTQFARDNAGDPQLELAHWDLAFHAERLRERRFAFGDEDLRPYFSFPKVLEGLFELAGRVFDARVEPADGEAPVWHQDVRFFRLHDRSGEHLASLYLDAYSRPEDKRQGAWMVGLQDRERLADGGLRRPLAAIVCNQTPPAPDRPSLMTFRDVQTLFHEFGHALQHLLTEVDDPHASGTTGVEWDAVELPSQFMENWTWHRDTLVGLSAHFETGAPLPEELFDKVTEARHFRSGTMVSRQVYLGQTDLELHHRLQPGADTPSAVHQRVAARTLVVPPLPEDRLLCAFAHLFAGGYAAGYYSYQWAEVLSADAFEAFEEVGLDDAEAVRELGHRFRETVLALGGSAHPMEVFRRFRGRDPSTAALLRDYGLQGLSGADGP